MENEELLLEDSKELLLDNQGKQLEAGEETPVERVIAESNNAQATEKKEVKNLDDHARWYVLHTYSNYEVVAKDNLEKVIKKEGLENRIFEIFIPTEEVVTEKHDKKVLVPTKTMPAYLFVKMIYGDDIWHTITRTNGITGFVGPKGRPLPLSDSEVSTMKLEKKVNAVITKIEVGDAVQVIDGQLAGQTAVVTGVDSVNAKCTVTVTMFGRPTNVDLELVKVRKI